MIPSGEEREGRAYQLTDTGMNDGNAGTFLTPVISRGR
jgi:hypothetical protein